MKLRLLVFLLLASMMFAATFESAQAYVFGMKSANNSIQNIQEIEEEYDMYFPMIGIIFDDWNMWEKRKVDQLVDTLGPDRIYHISFSPNFFTSREVNEGMYDAQYRDFFAKVKQYDLKVVFRTMHEVNGGRYPWSGDPISFKSARKHIYRMSREAGLDNKNIQFDFSVNHWDMPAKDGKPSQHATFVQCTPALRTQTGCLAFEDYYPGDEYVDIMGVTFYNRGKGNSNRLWLSPGAILNSKRWNTLERLKSYGKPIVVDEVATSAVRYTGAYSQTKSQEYYNTQYAKKNDWLKSLAAFTRSNEEIFAMVYFNVDYTVGLTNRIVGEADRSVINMMNGQFYNGVYDLIETASTHSMTKLASLFDQKAIWNNEKPVLIDSQDYAMFKALRQRVEAKIPDELMRLRLLRRLHGVVYDRSLEDDRYIPLERSVASLVRYYQ